eukprot:GFYU01032360.1.p1 GENE.GFYU01032360.1~~GFYU01032360.1.p1  ORF type:complete len:353 (-),score=102.65 GFYU01032360.1:170-1228(-)
MPPVNTCKGHKDSVTCVVNSQSLPNAHPHIFITGSDDSSVRTWDFRTLKSTQRLSGFDDKSEVTSLCQHPIDVHRLFCSAGQKVYEYDLRRTDILLNTFEGEISGFKDEINDIAIHYKGQYLATADDSNEVRVFDLSTNKLYKNLKKHKNIAMGVQFRSQKQWELTSASLDCTIINWDFGRPKPKCIINTSEEKSASRAQMVNPPFVFSIDYHSNAKDIVCGCGDGTVVVYDIDKARPNLKLQSHGAAVNRVKFSDVGGKCVILSGADDDLILWRYDACVEMAVTCEGSSDPDVKEVDLLNPADDQSARMAPCLHKFSHGNKTNDMCVMAEYQNVVVVDDSCDVSVYDLEHL